MDMKFLDADARDQLSEYIERLTTSGQTELDQNYMKKLKQICRASDDNLNHAFHLLMHQLEQDHSEIRLNAFIILDELFRRSHVFRETVLSDFQTLLELCVETDNDFPLPPPKQAAKKLKFKALQAIQTWHNKFGAAYKQLKLGYRFLKDCKKIDFADIETRSIAERQRNDAEVRRCETMLQKKVETVLQEMQEKREEIENTLTQVNNAFSILLQAEDNIFTADDFENNKLLSESLNDEKEKLNNEESTAMSSVNTSGSETPSCSDAMREHGFGNYTFSIDLELNKRKTFTVDDNNSSLVTSLQELIVVVKNKLIPMIEKWIQALTKAGTNKDQLLKSIDMKHAFNSALSKYRQLNIEGCENNRNDVDEESDDEFEEVCEKDGYEEEVKLHPVLNEFRPSSIPSTSRDLSFGKKTVPVDEEQDPSSYICNIKALERKLSRKEMKAPCGEEDLAIASTSSSTNCLKSEKLLNKAGTDDHKSKLLTKAPKLRFDVDLFQWNNNNITPSVVKFDSLHRFWAPRETDPEESIAPEVKASLRMRKIEFSGNFTPVKWQCRALLPNGKLCPRYDRIKCPFHGLVIARDERGNPTNPKDIARLKEEGEKELRDKPPDWQDPDLLRDIEVSIGIDLTVGKKKKKSKNRYPDLTDIKAAQNNARKRLEKIVCNKTAVKRVSSTLDRLDYKKHRDKFGDQFNYSYTM